MLCLLGKSHVTWKQRPSVTFLFKTIDLSEKIQEAIDEFFAPISKDDTQKTVCAATKKKVESFWEGYSVNFDFAERRYYFNAHPEKK